MHVPSLAAANIVLLLSTITDMAIPSPFATANMVIRLPFAATNMAILLPFAAVADKAVPSLLVTYDMAAS